MIFNERSYSGKIFRPRPEIFFSEEYRLLIAATPWGPRSSAKRVIEIIKDYYSLTLEDGDATNPFEKLSCLSPTANGLRVSTMLANEKLYRNENDAEYVTGVELFAAAIDEYEVAWIQIGHPNLLLARKTRGIFPLGSHVDLSLDLSQDKQVLSPLPSALLGLDPTCNLTIGSFRPQNGDRLILISRSALSENIYSLPETNWQIESISKILSKNDSELAYWLGILEL